MKQVLRMAIVLTILVVAFCHAQVPTWGLVGYWPFDGDANDHSGNGNNGAIVNAVATTDHLGNPGRALHLNGVDAYVRVENSPGLQALTDSITITGWVRITGIPDGWAAFCAKNDAPGTPQYGIVVNTTPDQVAFQFDDGTSNQVLGNYNRDFNLNQWYFIAVTWDGQLFRFYMDFNLLDSVFANPEIISNTQPLEFGRDTGGLTEYLNGDLDELRVYNRALSIAEIHQLYAEQSAPSLPQYFAGTGHWYQLIPNVVCWDEARDSAIARGGHLATILDAAEEDFVQSLLVPAPMAAWLGGYDPNNDGTWKWVTGETFYAGGQCQMYCDWAPGEPNYTGTENRLTIVVDPPAHPLYWNNVVNCGVPQSFPYLVEWSSNPNPGTVRIWIDSTTFNSGFAEVMMQNSYEVAAFTLPVLYHSAQPVDSVKRTGCRTENWESFHGTIYSDTTLLIGGTADFGGGTPCLSPGLGPIARIYFSPSCIDTPTVCFDTTYINEPGKLLVVECGTPPVSHVPEFVASCARYETSLPTPAANAGADLELHYCETSIRSLTAGCTDANGDIVSCELVSGPGTFDGQHITFVPNYGIYTFVVKATDVCNQVDYDTSTVTVLNCGDANGDCARNISDIVFLIQFIFAGGPAPSPLSTGDVDGNCTITISDAVYYINWIFAGGPEVLCGCVGGGVLPPHSKGSIGQADISTASIGGRDLCEIAINLDASSDARAIQLDFNITGDVRDIQIKSSLSDLQLFSSEVESGYRMGIIDLTGTAAIPAGKAQIATITYEGDGELSISSAIVVDNDASEMNVEITNSKLETALPTEYSLSQNQPNPFNPSTDISFSLPKTGQVKLVVYNILGAEVATLIDEVRSAGVHHVGWSGANSSGQQVASGIYLYRLTAGEFFATKKMMLLK